MSRRAWPALADWSAPSGSIATKRAVYGKVHRAPTDYRWIAWSEGYGSGPAPLEQELALGSEDAAATFYCWRYSAAGGSAVKCYPSRAFDAAGRPGGLEKQVLSTAAVPGMPPAALAFLMLPECAQLDDGIWWETWRDPRWASIDYHLPISGTQCPAIRGEGLESLMEQGVSELLAAVPGGPLTEFYARLLGGTRPAILYHEGPLLTPLALAALLLPLDREFTEGIQLAGGFPSSRLDAARLTNWSGVVCPPMIPVSEAASSGGLNSRDAAEAVRRLEHAISGPRPASIERDELSPGGSYVLGYLESPERWFVPGEQGTKSLAQAGPWPVIRRYDEAEMLCQHVADFAARIAALPDSPRARQLATKADLLRALVLALCPGPDTFRAVALPSTGLVPALYFAGRIEVQDWPELARYRPEQFAALARQSLYNTRVPLMTAEVRTWMRACAARRDGDRLGEYARRALALEEVRVRAAPDSVPAPGQPAG